MNFQKVEFLISAASPKDFPKTRLPEIAFAGKSNVGKSSVINRILQRKNFARVGEKPGKTIHVNYFTVDSKCYFVDLPGYGFAKVSAQDRDGNWFEAEGEELIARCFCHELDHLDGILYTQVMDRFLTEEELSADEE